MPRTTREDNKRRLKAASNLFTNIDEHLSIVWSCIPDEPKYKKYREQLENIGHIATGLRELIDELETGM